VITGTVFFTDFILIASEFGRTPMPMKFKYHLYPLTYEQRIVLEYLLLSEMEKQAWFGIVFLELWKTEGIICIQ
jgi:hypothetical protein